MPPMDISVMFTRGQPGGGISRDMDALTETAESW